MKQSLFCELVRRVRINHEIVALDFAWKGPAPRGGQFFMLRPRRTSVFLPRPLSAAGWKPAPDGGGAVPVVQFLALRRGRGTAELAGMRTGEEAELTGPLGNAWADFLPRTGAEQAGEGGKPVALIGGGIGIAPLRALFQEAPGFGFAFYAGFKTGFQDMGEKQGLLGPLLLAAGNLLIAAEDGVRGRKGRILDFFDPGKYAAVCACGPEPMLKAAAERCAALGVPCFVSLERRMACGAGACLGCTVRTVNGNRRCCADGPIFPAREVFFDGE